MQEDNSSFSLLLDLLSELYQKQPKIGYHLLYYLRARWVLPQSPGRGAPWGARPVYAGSSPLAVVTRELHGFSFSNSFNVYNAVVFRIFLTLCHCHHSLR